jgi:hypothetical protein
MAVGTIGERRCQWVRIGATAAPAKKNAAYQSVFSPYSIHVPSEVRNDEAKARGSGRTQAGMSRVSGATA